MFARASRQLASRALRSQALANTNRSAAVLPRAFHNTPALKDAAKPAEAKQFPPGIVAEDGIIAKYGTIPFFGMAAAILVTKEVFILDAEWLLAMETAAFAMTGYVLIGDSINKYCEKEDEAKTAQFNAANDFLKTMLDQYKTVLMTAQHKPEVLKEYLGEYKAAAQSYAAYETVVPRHKARAAVLATLEQIRSKEQHQASLEWQRKVDDAVANVTKAFQSGDEKLNQEMLTLAINSFGFDKPTTTEANDPVKRLFAQQFQDEE